MDKLNTLISDSANHEKIESQEDIQFINLMFKYALWGAALSKNTSLLYTILQQGNVDENSEIYKTAFRDAFTKFRHIDRLCIELLRYASYENGLPVFSKQGSFENAKKCMKLILTGISNNVKSFVLPDFSKYAYTPKIKTHEETMEKVLEIGRLISEEVEKQRPSYRIVQQYTRNGFFTNSYSLSFDYDTAYLENHEAFTVTLSVTDCEQESMMYIKKADVDSFVSFLKRAQTETCHFIISEDDHQWEIHIIHSAKCIFVVCPILWKEEDEGNMAKFTNKQEFLHWLGEMSEKLKNVNK